MGHLLWCYECHERPYECLSMNDCAAAAAESQGGMLLGRNSIRLTDSSRAYAICPHGMPEHVVIDLCRRSEEFRDSIRLTDSSRAYAICPHGMPEHVLIKLCRRSEGF
eukprot:119879-Pelagomonas_calceolata.AAC.1